MCGFRSGRCMLASFSAWRIMHSRVQTRCARRAQDLGAVAGAQHSKSTHAVRSGGQDRVNDETHDVQRVCSKVSNLCSTFSSMSWALPGVEEVHLFTLNPKPSWKAGGFVECPCKDCSRFTPTVIGVSAQLSTASPKGLNPRMATSRNHSL